MPQNSCGGFQTQISKLGPIAKMAQQVDSFNFFHLESTKIDDMLYDDPIWISLCLDNWTMELFIGFYDLVEEDLIRIIEKVRVSGKVLGAFNSTFLALIPKKDKPWPFNEFILISLCYCVYKLVAKIFVVKENYF
jgi:hypothetical protein